ncbi:hypothetical protein [Falsiroseomonas oryziterrae]|uniref:hypothetical protein n=1 Tax=Falsiroseomonas oryziterrae TaxID=2911368 RepID=UPI001F29CFF0|nr:hypothetical protein [Roseomonas sp. NPKOSM-4]
MFLAVGLALAAGSAGAQRPGCPELGALRTYRNEAFAIVMDYPAMFALDPGSVPASRDNARFWTADRRATAVVNVSRNRERMGLQELLRGAVGDVVQNSGGEVTYRAARGNWFVISGHMVGRIFYRRTMLLRSGAVATLWMEFPRDMRPCIDAAVTVMSRSFRER